MYGIDQPNVLRALLVDILMKLLAEIVQETERNELVNIYIIHNC